MSSENQIQHLSLKHLELDTLLDITNAINRQQDEQSLLKIFLFTVVANFKISKLAVYSRDIGAWKLILKHGTPPDFDLSQSIISNLGKNFSIINDSRLFAIEVKSHFDILIPVGRENKNIALVLLNGSFTKTKDGGDESLKFIQTIANIITVAIQNIRLTNRRLEQQAIKKEIELAKKLQTHLFPSSLPDTNWLKIYAHYLPQLMVGGDYYDYIKLNENEFIICIADVSGKGVPAAFLMSNLQSALRILTKQSFSIEKIVVELNDLVYHNARGEKFITLFIAHYDMRADAMTYINCGHNEPILFRRSGEKLYLSDGTLILGAFEYLPSIQTGVVNNISDTFLFAYTDGLTETFDKEDTGKGLDLVENIILESSIVEIHQNIITALSINNAPIDDITMLSCWVGRK